MTSTGRSMAMVVLMLAVPAGAARGDAGPSFLKEGAWGSATLRFDNLADYPDYDFYLKYGEGSGNPYSRTYLTAVHAGQPVQPFHGADRRTEVYLIAAQHGQPQPFRSPSNDWTELPPADCLQSAALQGTYAGSGYLVPYKVEIEDGKLTASMQPHEWLPGEWSLWWLKRLPCIAVPVAFCAALGWLGARIARRMFPPRPA